MTRVSAVCGVTIRRAAPDDAEVIHGWRREPTTRRYQPIRDLPLEQVRSQLVERAGRQLGPEVEGELQWVIEAERTPVGWATVRVIYREHGVGELGYTIGARYHRRGYMAAAIRLLLPIAFDPVQGVDLWRLEASAAVGNVATRSILERAGFRLEGVARASAIIGGERVDHARYALLRPEWTAMRASGDG